MLTNNGKPHVCREIAVHNTPLDKDLYLCPECDMPVDRPNSFEEKVNCEHHYVKDKTVLQRFGPYRRLVIVLFCEKCGDVIERELTSH